MRKSRLSAAFIFVTTVFLVSSFLPLLTPKNNDHKAFADGEPFLWLDKTDITSNPTTGPTMTFTKPLATDGAAQGNQYLRQGDSGVCQDSITTQPSAPNNGQLTIEKEGANPDKVLENVKAAYANLGIPDSAFVIIRTGIANPTKISECTLLKGIDVTIGATDNAKLNASATNTTCEGTAGPLGWLVCGVINFVHDTVQSIGSTISDLLKVDYLTNSDQRSAIYKAWSGARGLADALLIIVFLIIIFGQTLSIDAYTIKKALPRIVAAAVLIQLSFFLVTLLIDLFNIFGDNIGAVFNFATGQGYKINGILAAGGIFGAIAGAIAVVSAVMSGVALMAALGVIIAVMGVFLTLAFRKIAIILLIVTAPLALLAWVLPNTEKFFKMWWTNLIKILFMYPLIVLIFAVSNFAYNLNSVGLGKGFSDIPNQIISIFLIIAPLFAIPFVFKAGGQIMSFGAGVIMGRSNALAGKANNAQWVKDRKAFRTQERQQKGAELAQNASSRFGKARGRLSAAGVGGLLGTKRGQRLMDQRYAAGKAAADQDFDTAINRSGLSNDQLMGEGDESTNGVLEQIATAKEGTTVKLGNGRKVNVDASAKAKAIETLGRRGGMQQLRRVKAGMGLDDTSWADTPAKQAQLRERQAIFDQGTAPVLPDIMTKAPDIIKGSKAFEDVSAEQLSGFTPDTIAKMTEHIGSLPASVKDPVTGVVSHPRAEAHARLNDAIKKITENPQLAAKVTKKQGQTLRNGASGLDAATQAVINSAIDANGNVIGVPPAAVPPTPTTATAPATGAPAVPGTTTPTPSPAGPAPTSPPPTPGPGPTPTPAAPPAGRPGSPVRPVGGGTTAPPSPTPTAPVPPSTGGSTQPATASPSPPGSDDWPSWAGPPPIGSGSDTVIVPPASASDPNYVPPTPPTSSSVLPEPTDTTGSETGSGTVTPSAPTPEAPASPATAVPLPGSSTTPPASNQPGPATPPPASNLPLIVPSEPAVLPEPTEAPAPTSGGGSSEPAPSSTPAPATATPAQPATPRVTDVDINVTNPSVTLNPSAPVAEPVPEPSDTTATPSSIGAEPELPSPPTPGTTIEPEQPPESVIRNRPGSPVRPMGGARSTSSNSDISTETPTGADRTPPGPDGPSGPPPSVI